MWPMWGIGTGGSSMDDTEYPTWSHVDLALSTTGTALGNTGSCAPGHVYAGTTNQICGGGHWGDTNLEVWIPASAATQK